MVQRHCLCRPVINTPLQRGGGTCEMEVNRFSGFWRYRRFCGSRETAKAVETSLACAITPLKRGVNERRLLGPQQPRYALPAPARTFHLSTDR